MASRRDRTSRCSRERQAGRAARGRSAPTWARPRRSARSTIAAPAADAALARPRSAPRWPSSASSAWSSSRTPRRAASRPSRACAPSSTSLLDRATSREYDRRAIEYHVDNAQSDAVVEVASQLLSEQTRLLGFVVRAAARARALQHVSLVRLVERARARGAGVEHGRRLSPRDRRADGRLDQRELDRMASRAHRARRSGRTLREVRDALRARGRARCAARPTACCAARARARRARGGAADDEVDLVVATRLALLDQPEFRDPRRHPRDARGARDEGAAGRDRRRDARRAAASRWRSAARWASPRSRTARWSRRRYGASAGSLGAVGVIGPSRMDYSRVIPLVGFCLAR